MITLLSKSTIRIVPSAPVPDVSISLHVLLTYKDLTILSDIKVVAHIIVTLIVVAQSDATIVVNIDGPAVWLVGFYYRTQVATAKIISRQFDFVVCVVFLVLLHSPV